MIDYLQRIYFFGSIALESFQLVLQWSELYQHNQICCGEKLNSWTILIGEIKKWEIDPIEINYYQFALDWKI